MFFTGALPPSHPQRRPKVATMKPSRGTTITVIPAQSPGACLVNSQPSRLSGRSGICELTCNCAAIHEIEGRYHYLPHKSIEQTTTTSLPHRHGKWTEKRVAGAVVSKLKESAPPLAIFHICKTCKHPRSQRYHQTHPIPLGTTLPPPGNCRRCRTARKASSKDFGVSRESNSATIKLGVRVLVPDNAYMSHLTMEENMDRKVIDYVTGKNDVSEKDTSGKNRVPAIAYRHVRARSVSYNQSPSRRFKNTDCMVVKNSARLESSKFPTTISPRANHSS